jgi:hypothetical protein
MCNEVIALSGNPRGWKVIYYLNARDWEESNDEYVTLGYFASRETAEEAMRGLEFPDLINPSGRRASFVL